MRLKIFLISILSLLIIPVINEDPTLIYVQQLFRHGARYPIYPNSIDGSQVAVNDKAVGELTRQGKSMHYMLGDILYHQYWKKLFGTNVNSYSQTKFYFKSTDINRTIQSLQSQLMGLFQNTDVLTISGVETNFSKPVWDVVPDRQPGDLYYNSPKFHALPIHVEKPQYTPWKNADFLRIYAPEFCYRQNDWMKANLRNPNIVKILSDPNFVSAINALSDVVGKNLTFTDVYKYYDNAQCLKYMSIKPLSIFEGNTKVSVDLRTIAILDGYIKMFYTEQQLRATSTGYFNETVNHFKRVTANQAGVQWSFYSAHDTTVMNFITRLGLTSVDCIYQNYLNGTVLNSQTKYCIVEYPTYTSQLIFEVYKYSNKNTFKIRYNGFYRLIPFCGWQEECQVEEMYKWFDSWKDVDYPKTCGISDSTSESYFSIMMIELAVIIVFAVAGILSYLNKKKEPIITDSSNKHSEHADGLKQPAHIQDKIQDSLLSEDHV